jgi:hypothetical protein
MKDRIKTTIKRLQKTKNPLTFYLERLENLLNNFTKDKWINTGQYQNAIVFQKNYPNFEITKGVKQVLFFAGEYIVELMPNGQYKWEDCIYDTINEVEDCLWEKEYTDE